MHVQDAHKTKIDGNEMANVDGSDDPRARVDYLDQVTKLAGDYKRVTYQMIDLKPGDAVLDVGCGAGDDVRAMAEFIGPAGRAVGIDLSQTMIDEARKRSGGQRSAG
ncbi:MAG: methyltransferase domain-containing protein [Thermomicrobiales bacterium]